MEVDCGGEKREVKKFALTIHIFIDLMTDEVLAIDFIDGKKDILAQVALCLFIDL